MNRTLTFDPATNLATSTHMRRTGTDGLQPLSGVLATDRVRSRPLGTPPIDADPTGTHPTGAHPIWTRPVAADWFVEQDGARETGGKDVHHGAVLEVA